MSATNSAVATIQPVTHHHWGLGRSNHWTTVGLFSWCVSQREGHRWPSTPGLMGAAQSKFVLECRETLR